MPVAVRQGECYSGELLSGGKDYPVPIKRRSIYFHEKPSLDTQCGSLERKGLPLLRNLV